MSRITPTAQRRDGSEQHRTNKVELLPGGQQRARHSKKEHADEVKPKKNNVKGNQVDWFFLNVLHNRCWLNVTLAPMNSPPVLIACAHGTRNAEGQAAIRRVMAEIETLRPRFARG